MFRTESLPESSQVLPLPPPQPSEPKASLQPVDRMPTAKQIHCPVSGFGIDSGYSAEFEGQRVYFCGPYCRELFLKQPRAYMATYHKGLKAVAQTTIEAGNSVVRTQPRDHMERAPR